MARPNPIRSMMLVPLPSITYQRKKLFRPTNEDVIYAYTIINRYVFDNALKRPEITLGIIQKAWGVCSWEPVEQGNGSSCTIRLMDKWFCQQWFVNTLAHEMVHQHQWDVYRWEHLNQHGKPMFEGSGAHGPSFYAFRERFEYYGLNLKIHFGQKRWFTHQNFNKC